MSEAQLSFDAQLVARRFPDLQSHIEQDFWNYHHANPDVWRLFKQFAYQIKMGGRKKYGAAAIIERIRWHIEIETNAGDFKINNNYRACYARLLIEEDPAFREFFEIRRTPGILEVQS